MAPIGTDQIASVDVLTERLVLAVAGRGIVSVQNPVRLDEWSEPQPDVVIFKRRADF